MLPHCTAHHTLKTTRNNGREMRQKCKSLMAHCTKKLSMHVKTPQSKHTAKLKTVFVSGASTEHKKKNNLPEIP